jgi:hypothetical protein
MKKILLTLIAISLSITSFSQNKFIRVESRVGGTMMKFSLFQKQSDNSYDLIDAADEDGGTWTFDSLSSGVYRVHVNIEYNKYLPTWHPYKAIWEEAQDIDLNSTDSFICSNGMLPNPVFLGPCAISGNLVEGNLFAPGDPLKNVRVLLYRDSVLIKMINTNDSGKFNASNLPIGTYKIRTDIVNAIDPTPKTVTVDSTNTSANIDLTINKNGTINTWLNKTVFTDLSIYPNPAKTDVEIHKSGKFELQLMDINGKFVMKQSAFNNTSIDVSQYDNGVYFLRISSGNKHVVEKLIVQ